MCVCVVRGAYSKEEKPQRRDNNKTIENVLNKIIFEWKEIDMDMYTYALSAIVTLIKCRSVAHTHSQTTMFMRTPSVVFSSL